MLHQGQAGLQGLQQTGMLPPPLHRPPGRQAGTQQTMRQWSTYAGCSGWQLAPRPAQRVQAHATHPVTRMAGGGASQQP